MKEMAYSLFCWVSNHDSIDKGIWIILETRYHKEFAYSTNLKVKMENLLDTIVIKSILFIKS
jgi:hypothetical protein